MIVCTKFKIKLIALFAAIGAVIIILCVALPSCSHSVDFNATFYYVCYDSPNDAYSASSVSSVVQSYGGAGYTIEKDGKYFVTVACYYASNDAETVCSTLKKRGVGCSVVKVEVKNRKTKGPIKLYEGNLKTLLSVSKVCYDLANSLDYGTKNQSGARAVLEDVKTNLTALSRHNQANVFTAELDRLLKECDEVAEGYVFSSGVRRLQVAITDVIANANLL